MTALPEVVKGYPMMASFIGNEPELAIFRRFGDLTARNLLYYQSELISLSARLRRIEYQDYCDPDPEKKANNYSRNWYFLQKSKERDDCPQYKLIMEMREKLAEYQKALIRAQKVANMADPMPIDLNELQHFLEDGKGMARCISGYDRDTWGTVKDPTEWAPDLTVLRGRNVEDKFSRWMQKSIVTPILTRFKIKKPDPVLGYPSYREGKLLELTHFLTSLVATAILLVSITILYFIKSSGARLGAIAGFNVLFSLCLHIFSLGKRIEIFAACCAFAAVQVVFISNFDVPPIHLSARVET